MANRAHFQPSTASTVGANCTRRSTGLPHLAGFGGNGHVRIGNDAMNQRQNDLMGELLLSLDSLLADPRLVEGDRPSSTSA